jgi:predicted anti-sigma-YlaC factor YlaD
MLTCKDVSALVSQSLDRRLSWHERCNVRLHLLICRACTRFQRQLAFLRRVARDYADYAAHMDSEARLSPAARERIARAISNQS